jgi:hypothetical protein
MSLQWIGLVAALSAFLGIWLGHVGVRKIESVAPTIWLPAAGALVLGLLLEAWSLRAGNLHISAATGILGITLLWDALEFVRQERRVKKGHAPANPANPRHVRILADYPAATTLDLLDRDPVGRPVTPEEAVRLVSEGDRKGAPLRL